ncbi:hypothetical protein ACWD4L_11640 [Streptomyces sp. NPDC002596]
MALVIAAAANTAGDAELALDELVARWTGWLATDPYMGNRLALASRRYGC